MRPLERLRRRLRSKDKELKEPKEYPVIMMDDSQGEGLSVRLDTIAAPVKECIGVSLSKQPHFTNIPNDIVLKNDIATKNISVGGTGIPQNASHARTLATMTETFSSSVATSTDQEEDSTLMSSSLTYLDSFEVHQGMSLKQKSESTEEGDKREQSLSPTARLKFGKNDYIATLYAEKDQNEIQKRYSSQPIARQRASVPISLLMDSSGESWNEQSGNHREVSLFDTIDSRDDDEEEDRGHEGDDERDSPVKKKRTPVKTGEHSPDDAFEGGPKFAGMTMTHPVETEAMSFQSNISSSASYTTTSATIMTPLDSAEQEFFKSIESAEMEKKKKAHRQDKSIIEQKGMFDTLKDLIYCVPGGANE